MPKSEYGTDYSRYLNAPPDPRDPFPRPVNDAQRVANARARAERDGVRIGSGYLNPKTGELQDPDRGIGKYLPIIGPAAVGAASLGLGMLGGPWAAGATTMIPGTGIPAVAGTGPGVTAPLGSMAAGSGATGALGGQAINQQMDRLMGDGGDTAANVGKGLLSKLTSVQGLTSLAPIIAALASRGGGGSGTSAASTDFMNRAYDDAKRINAMKEARYRRVDPLHEMATQLAASRMPVNVQQPVPRVPLPE